MGVPGDERGILDRASAIAARVEPRTAEIEHARTLPADLAREIARAGLFRLLVPGELGGLECAPATMVRAIETVARADGSAGWCTMIGATTGLIAAFLPEPAAREIFGDPETVVGGVFHPRGIARVEDGGYRVRGRWPFASGCRHCAWLLGGAIVHQGDATALRADGKPEARMMIFRAHEVEILDTWNVSGLRGTGSHDIAVADVFVPRERSVWFSTDPARAKGALYAMPTFGLLASGIAGVALGIAAGAIADLAALASVKTPTGGGRPLAARGAIQTEMAQATAALESARTHLLAVLDEAFAYAQRGGSFDAAARARIRLAATHATRESARVVDRMYEAGGGTAIYETSPLQRRFRDVHVATQHVMVAPATWEVLGRILLGLETDTELL
ncbi:MAG: hydrolase [Deltaproteobacteria bacterium]|nr:hydrolase [Deltaproteobacteria bacterium]